MQRLSSRPMNLPLRRPASHVSIGSETSSMSTAEGSEAPSLGTPLGSSPLPFTSSLGGASSFFGSSFCNTQSVSLLLYARTQFLLLHARSPASQCSVAYQDTAEAPSGNCHTDRRQAVLLNYVLA